MLVSLLTVFTTSLSGFFFFFFGETAAKIPECKGGSMQKFAKILVEQRSFC